MPSPRFCSLTARGSPAPSASVLSTLPERGNCLNVIHLRALALTVGDGAAPRSIFEGLTPATVDRGITAWVIPESRLAGLKPTILDWMAVAPK